MAKVEQRESSVSKHIRRWGLQVVASTALLLGGGKVAVYTPDTSDKSVEAAENGYEVFPGWIEQRGEKPPFIQLDKGHFKWLRAKIYGNPILFDLTRDFFTHLEDLREKGERIRLGDALTFNIIRAQEKMAQIESNRIDPRTNLHLEIGRLALFPLAAGFTAQWWTEEDLARFGVSLDGFQDINDYHWGTKGVGRIVYPRLFGIEEEEPTEIGIAKIKNSGEDRTIHVAHHLLIAFEDLYSRQYSLSVHESKPVILRLLSTRPDSFLYSSPYVGVRTQSFIIGRLYELSGLKDPKNWPVNGRTSKEIVEGPFDSMVDADYLGNEFGVAIAEALHRRLQRRQFIDDVIFRLNDPRYERFDTEPVLGLSY